MKNKLAATIFAGLLAIGIFVCAVCNLAINNTLTWDLIPINSIIFAWLILIPIVSSSKKGICFSLIMPSHYDWAIKKLKAHRKNCEK